MQTTPAQIRAILLFLAAALAIVLSAASGRAAPPPPPPPPPTPTPTLPRFMRLEYLRPPGSPCPKLEELQDLVIIDAKRDPFDNMAPALLRVSIVRRGPRYEAKVEILDAAGVNVWPRPPLQPRSSCDGLAQDVAFVVGDRLHDPPPPPALPPKVEPPAPPPPAPPPKVEPPAPPPTEPLRLNLGLAGALELQTAAPVLAFNLAADAGLRWRSFSVAVEFRWTPPQVADVDATGHAWINVMQFSEGIVPCGHFRALLYCGVGQVVEVWGRSSPGLMPASRTQVAVAAGGRIGGDLLLPWWGRRSAVRLTADMLGTLQNAAFHVVGMNSPTWTEPGLTVALGAGFVTDMYF